MEFKVNDLVKVVDMKVLSKVNTNGNEEDCFEFLDKLALVKFVEGNDIHLEFIEHEMNTLLNRVEYVFTEEELELMRSGANV